MASKAIVRKDMWVRIPLRALSAWGRRTRRALPRSLVLQPRSSVACCSGNRYRDTHSLDEQSPDIGRLVAKEVARVCVVPLAGLRATHDTIVHATSVRLDEPSQEALGVALKRDALLPGLEDDASKMLPTG